MYQDYFQFHLLPFENTPDPRFFYESEQHREALAAIEYTIRMRKGFVLITGEIGSGKTTVGRTVCERSTDRARIITILHGHCTGRQVIRQILRAMQIPFSATDDHTFLLEKLRNRLLSHAGDTQAIVLLIDEAQTLSNTALEELRLLSNFDTVTQKLVQVVLVGQPELRQRIQQPGFDALRQRIVIAKQIQPLSLEDTQRYISHRIRVASRAPQNIQVKFSDAAIRQIYRTTNGLPRLLNITCDNCLLLAMVRDVRQVEVEMVVQVAADALPRFDEPNIVIPIEPEFKLARSA